MQWRFRRNSIHREREREKKMRVRIWLSFFSFLLVQSNDTHFSQIQLDLGWLQKLQRFTYIKAKIEEAEENRRAMFDIGMIMIIIAYLSFEIFFEQFPNELDQTEFDWRLLFRLDSSCRQINKAKKNPRRNLMPTTWRCLLFFSLHINCQMSSVTDSSRSLFKYPQDHPEWNAFQRLFRATFSFEHRTWFLYDNLYSE